ncbi:Pyridoxal phosphate homeostasis protein [Hondaea fermentalgiana]|uniref:Pyridoxal phosphate homeostasis protein n=1 Tax=Hondaea fermentalgiana TaxID=2315210 RepID=A0A2R5G3U9_9STRA|nr:Pyridoxal phosphate homeostasis protein [Hondaea fermentalgiana]|eukprot:GBG25707.1 Pyridoxal phosphate homeostasis protein [Hondaea fermentalgiana]
MSSGATSAALRSVRGRIAELCGQLGRAEPTLVAVSKTKPNAMVQEAYDAGQRHFGENYVQELVGKAPDLPSDIKWHFIGMLQSNKAKQIASLPNIYIVESVHSQKLANALNKHVPEDRKEKLRVLVQVNTSGEDSKSGIEPDGCVKLVTHVIEECDKLQFAGLMTIGRLGDVSPECFDLLNKCKQDVLAAHPQLADQPFEMSMGMSGDFELAIEHGSTSVRVGSSIFGARDYAPGKGPEAALKARQEQQDKEKVAGDEGQQAKGKEQEPGQGKGQENDQTSEASQNNGAAAAAAAPATGAESSSSPENSSATKPQ